MRIQTRALLPVLLAAVVGAGAAAAEPTAGIAVAPLRAVDAPEGTASILTGLAESLAQRYVREGRLVAHGELLRAVDAGEDAGCRDEACLGRAAAAVGAAHLVSGEVGTLGDTLVISVRVTATGDGATRSAVSRECRECDPSALPAMLEEALLEALSALVPAAPAGSGDARDVTLVRQRGEGEFRYEDATRTLQRAQLEVGGLQLSALTRPLQSPGCVEAGDPLAFETVLEVHNPGPRTRTLRGTLALEVLGLDGDEPLARAEQAVTVTLASGADEAADGGPAVDDEGVWVPPAHVARESLAVTWTAAPLPGLRLRTTWDEELLDELQTRPVTAAARLEEFHLTHDGQRATALRWGEEMEAHLALTRVEGAPAAEVTLRMERMIRFWFDTENVQAVHVLPEDAEGTYQLRLPFVPNAARRDSSRGYVFEVWVNGCSLYRSELYE